jgi:regulator of cell morphogenesis and NO signaling
MTIDRNRTVGEFAVEYPLATRVFARHGIDFCCGGGKSLHEACGIRNLDTDTILEEIRKEVSGTDESPQRWEEAPLGDLIDHILINYHRPLDAELPRLEAMARKVNDVHGEKAEEMLSGVLSTYLALKAELKQHMAKEEQILFPMIKNGQGAMAGGPVSVMMHEHDNAGAALERLRTLTRGYEVPAAACNTWRALWHGLAALETSLQQHIHLENNILFPRATTGEWGR